MWLVGHRETGESGCRADAKVNIGSRCIVSSAALKPHNFAPPSNLYGFRPGVVTIYTFFLCSSLVVIGRAALFVHISNSLFWRLHKPSHR